jgi:thiol:disulfide interchange protein
MRRQTPQAPPSEEVMRRVKAITSAAVEAERATTNGAKPAVAERRELVAQPEESSWKGTLMTVVLLAVGAGLGVNLFRRRQAQSA